MLEHWFLLALAAGVFSVLFNTLNRHHLQKGNDSTAYAWWFEFYRACFFAVFLFFDFQFSFSWQNLIALLILGCSEFIAVYCFMKMHSRMNLSVSSVVTQLRIFLVPLMAFLFLGELLAPNVYMGIGLLAVGLWLTVSLAGLRDTNGGIKYALVFAVASAFSSVLTKYVSGFASVSVIMFAFSAVPVILLPFFMDKRRGRLLHSFINYKERSFFAALANIGTLLLLGYAYKVGSVTQITGVFLSMFVGNVLIGTLFMKEKLSIKQVVGILLVLLAIALLY